MDVATRLSRAITCALVILISWYTAGSSAAAAAESTAPLAFERGDLSRRLTAGAQNETTLRADPQSLEAFSRSFGGRVSIASPFGPLELALESAHVLSPGALVTETTDQGRRSLDLSIRFFAGHIRGRPGSQAIFGFGRRGVWARIIDPEFGTLALQPTGIGTGQTASSTFDLSREESQGTHLGNDEQCGVVAPGGSSRPSDILERDAYDRTMDDGSERLLCKVAAESDYALFVRFGHDAEATAEYIATLFAAVGMIFERDANIALRVARINVWSVPDPFAGNGCLNALPVFRGSWLAANPGVNDSYVHLVSGTQRGGCAYYPQSCGNFWTFGISGPVVGIVAHELGHNLDLWHTHSCFWQLYGYAPPGTVLDRCSGGEWACVEGPIGEPFNGGTIMSYCRGKRLAFHEAARRRLRDIGTQCLPAFEPQPVRIHTVVRMGSDVMLGWDDLPDRVRTTYEVWGGSNTLDLERRKLIETRRTSIVLARDDTEVFWVATLSEGGDREFSQPAILSRATLFPDMRVDAVSTGLGPANIAVGNWSPGDLPGVATVSTGDDVLRILTAMDGGAFEERYTFPLRREALGLASGDLNGDKIDDLVVTHYLNAGLTFFLSKDRGQFVERFEPIQLSHTARSIAIADIDQDGRDDLVVPLQGQDGIEIRMSGEGGPFVDGLRIGLPGPAEHVSHGDLNGDGRVDLVVALPSRYEIAVLWGGADGGFETPELRPSAVHPYFVCVGDVDGDGLDDVLASGLYGVMLTMSTPDGLGDATFISKAVNGRGVRLADVDGDGAVDVVVADFGYGGQYLTSSGVLVLKGDGAGGFWSPVQLTGAVFAYDIEVVDLDDDADLDIVAGTTGSALVTLRNLDDQALTIPMVARSNAGGNGRAEQKMGRLPISLLATTAVSGDEIDPSSLTIGTAHVAFNGHFESISTLCDFNKDGMMDLCVMLDLKGASLDFAAPLKMRGSCWDGRRIQGVLSLAGRSLSPAAVSESVQEPAATLRLVSITPNPGREKVAITFVAPGNQPATANLFDVAGRRVMQMRIPAGGDGERQIVLGEGLKSGIYYLDLSQSGRRVRERFVKLP